MIGAFGQVVFRADSRRVMTFSGFTRSREAVFAEHAVAQNASRLQHVGQGLDEISFSVKLSDSLGVDVEEEIHRLRGMLDQGAAYPLVLGGKVLGAFVLTKIDEGWSVVDGSGRIRRAKVKLILREFV